MGLAPATWMPAHVLNPLEANSHVTADPMPSTLSSQGGSFPQGGWRSRLEKVAGSCESFRAASHGCRRRFQVRTGSRIRDNEPCTDHRCGAQLRKKGGLCRFYG